MNDQEPLVQQPDVYSDTFVSIDGASNTLCVNHYSLLTPTLKVSIPTLLYIRPASQVVTRVGLRNHGLSSVGIRWARDWHRGNIIVGPRRGYAKSFVIKVRGERTRSGFSVEDPDRFLAVLERVHPGITNSHADDEIRTELEPDMDDEHW